MKLPEYSLKKGIQVKDPQNAMSDPLEFPSGTLVFPFWNETLLPGHIREQLNEAKRFAKETKIVMCLIGRTWVPLPKDNIRSSQ